MKMLLLLLTEHESGISEGNISMQTKRIRRRRKFKKRHSKRGKPKYKRYFIKYKTRRRRRRYSYSNLNLEHSSVEIQTRSESSHYSIQSKSHQERKRKLNRNNKIHLPYRNLNNMLCCYANISKKDFILRKIINGITLVLPIRSIKCTIVIKFF